MQSRRRGIFVSSPEECVVAASVRIEDEAFADERYEDLAHHAGLADADHARGKMARIWRQCTIEGTNQVENQMVMRVFGSGGVEALVRARLAELAGPSHVRIRGTEGRIEWLQKLRENGNKGGRPKGSGTKPLGSPDPKPLGSSNGNPPAPAPAPIDQRECQGDTALATQLVLRILKNNPRHKIGRLAPEAKGELLEKWASHVRLMRTADGRTESEIKSMIDWCQADSFWRANILSTSKLRDQWDQLVAHRTRDSKQPTVRVQQPKDDRPRQVMLDGVLVDA
jgi:hypothetical protein